MTPDFMVLVLFVSAGVLSFGYLVTQLLGEKYLEYQTAFLARMSDRLENLFIQATAARRLIVVKWLFFLIFAATGAWITRHAGIWILSLFALLAGTAGFFLPDLYPRYIAKKRLERFDQMLPDALITISACLRSGLSFPQACQFLVSNSDPPISEEFGLVVRETQVGVSMDDALKKMLERVPTEDLEIFVTAVTISRQVGGNLVEIFDTMAETIRQRQQMQGRIRAITAQGKLQTVVVAVLPLALAFAIKYIQPDLMAVLTGTAVGWVLIAGCVVWEIIGLMMIRKIVDVEI